MTYPVHVPIGITHCYPVPINGADLYFHCNP